MKIKHKIDTIEKTKTVVVKEPVATFALTVKQVAFLYLLAGNLRADQTKELLEEYLAMNGLFSFDSISQRTEKQMEELRGEDHRFLLSDFYDGFGAALDNLVAASKNL